MKAYETLNDRGISVSVNDAARDAKMKVKAVRLSLMCVMATIVASPMFSYAAGDMEEKIKDALNQIQDALVAITLPLYGVVAVICLIMMVAGSGRNAEAAKGWLIRATIAAAAILSVAAIVEFVESLGQ